MTFWKQKSSSGFNNRCDGGQIAYDGCAPAEFLTKVYITALAWTEWTPGYEPLNARFPVAMENGVVDVALHSFPVSLSIELEP
jgi:hypothetical protein